MEDMPDVSPLIDSIGRDSVLALLALIFILGALMIAGIMRIEAKRAREREDETKRDHTAQLARERQNAEAYKGTTDRVIDVVEGNTHVITSLSEIVRPIGPTLERMNPTLERIEQYINSDGMDVDE